MARPKQSNDWFLAVVTNLGYGIFQAIAGMFPGWPIFLGVSVISVLFCVYVVFPFLDHVFGRNRNEE